MSISTGRNEPETVRMAFAPPVDLATAEAYTRDLTRSHYENFSVVSVLLPKHLRQDFCNVYAFCRIADDLGDEVSDDAVSLSYLERFAQETQNCFAGSPTSLIFVALRQTITKYDIPIKPFLDLIDAFEQDRRVNRYETFEQVVDYCTRSADPVGRLVLYMCGYRDEQRQKLSDKICTALQLTNFWQDVRRDFVDRNRIYLPRESMEKFGVSEQQIADVRCDRNYRELIKFEVNRTAKMFDEGEPLLDLLDPQYRGQIALFVKGGREILEAIRRQNYDTLTSRPKLSRWQKGKLIASAVIPRGMGYQPMGKNSDHGLVARATESSNFCREITKQQARNFYYGLMLLPEPKRSDMFALYAYMRMIDDIADQEDGRSIEQRLKELDRWRELSHAALRGEILDHHPLWPSFSEMAQRCKIPSHIIDDVVEGQRQDLYPLKLKNFDELKQYCYRVAGVVGLASIYIWGFEGGEETRQLAIERGLAFQLTNILRDIREDLSRGRIYLPEDELEAMRVDILGLGSRVMGHGATPEARDPRPETRFLDFMRFQIARAEKYYHRSSLLEDRIAADSVPTLRAMTQIYYGILQRIADDPLRVLHERVSLSLPSKLKIAWRASRGRK